MIQKKINFVKISKRSNFKKELTLRRAQKIIFFESLTIDFTSLQVFFSSLEYLHGLKELSFSFYQLGNFDDQ